MPHANVHSRTSIRPPQRGIYSVSIARVWVSSIFARSWATSALFHAALLLFLAVLYASDIPPPLKPIALCFEESNDVDELAPPVAKVILALADTNVDLDQTHEESMSVLADIPATTPDVASTFANHLGETEFHLVSISHADARNLSAVVMDDHSHERDMFADDQNAVVGKRVQRVSVSASSRSEKAPKDSAIPQLLSAAEFGKRLQAVGAKTGDVQISLTWNTIDDVDLHLVYTPGNGLVDTINWTKRRGRLTDGMLDVDMNANSDTVSLAPVENVFWPSGSSPRGQFSVYVHFFRSWSGQKQVPVLVRIKNGNEVAHYLMVAVLQATPQRVWQFTLPNRDSQRKF